MGLDIGAELVTAKKRITSKKGVAFALEVKIFGKPRGFISVLLHPTHKMRRLARALLVSKVTRNECFPDGEASVRGENHVRQSRLRLDQMNGAFEFGQRRVEIFPLPLGDRRLGATRTTHPGINFVLDAVIIRRTEQQFAHGTGVSSFRGDVSRPRPHYRPENRSAAAGMVLHPLPRQSIETAPARSPSPRPTSRYLHKRF